MGSSSEPRARARVGESEGKAPRVIDDKLGHWLKGV